MVVGGQVTRGAAFWEARNRAFRKKEIPWS